MNPILEGFLKALELIFSLDREVISITLLSFRVSFTAVFLSSIVGVPIATLLSFKDFFGKRFVVNLIHTMMALPPVVVGLFVYLFLSRKGFFGPLELLYTPLAMIIAQFIMATPIITGVSFSAISSVDKVIRDTAKTLGATKFQEALKVLREARFGLVTAIVTGFGAAISEVGAIMIVGGNIRFHTRALTTAIVLETRRGNFELAIALGLILIMVAFFVNSVLTFVQQRGYRR